MNYTLMCYPSTLSHSAAARLLGLTLAALAPSDDPCHGPWLDGADGRSLYLPVYDQEADCYRVMEPMAEELRLLL